jgi:hypothetical protein
VLQTKLHSFYITTSLFERKEKRNTVVRIDIRKCRYEQNGRGINRRWRYMNRTLLVSNFTRTVDAI